MQQQKLQQPQPWNSQIGGLQSSTGCLSGQQVAGGGRSSGAVAGPITTQLSSSLAHLLPPAHTEQQECRDANTHAMLLHLGCPDQHIDATATAVVTIAGAAAACHSHDKPAADTLLQQEPQLQHLQQQAATLDATWANLQLDVERQPPQPEQPCTPLGELQLLLPAVHAEYRAEMSLMLRACQLASTATRHSTVSGSTLLLDPGARNQLQRQVLANCNDKHAAVSAAFRQAARAVEAAAAACGCDGFGNKGAAADAPEASRSTDLEQTAADGSMTHVWQCLTQLRSAYQQELVAATSALFAICRGFGQRYVLRPAVSAAIKAALAAAQQQHARVEQLWQDVVLAASGGL